MDNDGCAAIQDIEISVVVACYTEKRIAGIKAALTSLRKQSLEPRRIVVAVDNNESLAARLTDEFDWITVVLNRGEPGSSPTRNRGVQAVDTEFTAFLDDDETADVDWLLELARPFADGDVVGAGGKYEPKWSAGKPWWFPDEFAWAVGGAYLGMPTDKAEVRNVWSGNMVVRTAVFRAVGGFRAEFGKRASLTRPEETDLRVPEDTDLCIRMAAASGGRWIYVPTAVINHDIPHTRASLSFLASRCFAEGSGKTLMSMKLHSASAIDMELSYVRTTTLTAIRRLFSTRFVPTAQGFVMLIGLVSAMAGYVAARLRIPRPDLAAEAPRTEGKKPALLVDYDLSTPLCALRETAGDLSDYERVWTILRSAGTLRAIIEAPASIPAIEEHIIGAVQRETTERTDSPIDTPLADSGPQPSMTVVICTRERPTELARVLGSLELQTYRDFSVMVVDNAPTSDGTKDVADRFRERFPSVRYVVEPKPGLSQARNCALGHLDTELVAWLDDDETADRNWLTEIVKAFRSRPDAAAVSGTVLPAELETWPQWWFEQYGGHSKGRGFSREVFAYGDTGEQSPLYPLPPFGVGANMAFRTTVLHEMGGFDVGLGAGTVTFGGEDVLIFSQLLLSGHTIVYEPAAMTRHFHRRTYAALERQMYGYGVGLTAFYAALLRWDWRLILPLVALAPRALIDMSGRRSSAITCALPNDFPSHLFRVKRRGMLVGPLAYVNARRSAGRERVEV